MSAPRRGSGQASRLYEHIAAAAGIASATAELEAWLWLLRGL